MKKLLSIFIIIFSLFIVNVNAKDACNSEDIVLKSIELKDKSEYVEELSKASIENKKLNLDLKMYDVGDYIEYIIQVENNTDKDYNFDEKSIQMNSNYFDYSLSSSRIKAHKIDTIYLKVQYKKEIEKDKFFRGKYHNQDNVSLVFLDTILSNPLTNNNTNLLLGILLVVQILLYFNWENKKIKSFLFIMEVALFLPITTYALCNISIEIDSNITIGSVKPNPCTYDGELVPGAEYVNGQYTYRYMQEETYNGDWQSIDNDGWGVKLTDKESTDDVTTKLCTSINDKPIASMSFMFSGSKTSNIDLSSFDTSNVTNMYRMFHSVKNVENYDLGSFDTSNVTDMGGMFYDNDSLKEINLSMFNTKKIKQATTMLASCPELTDVKLDNWDISNVSVGRNLIGGLFSEDNNIKKISLKNWKIPEDFSSGIGCNSSGLCAENLEIVDVTGWDLSKTKNASSLFGNLYAKEIKGLDTWNVSNITDMSQMFLGNKNLVKIDLNNWDASNVTDMSNMFSYCTSLKEASLANIKTSNLIKMTYLFEDDISLEKVNLEGLDTSKVEEMSGLFYNNSSLKKINFSNLNLNNVLHIGSLFGNCSSLEEVNLENWNFSNNNSIQMGGMFSGDTNIKKVNMKNWMIPESFESMIGCRKLTLCSNNIEYVDVTGWDLSKTKSINGLFGNLYAKEIRGLDSWDTSNVENIANVFGVDSNITSLDLSSWDTSKVNQMGALFYGCTNLAKIYVSDKFKTDNVNDSYSMFYDCSKIVGGNGTVYDSNHVDKEYARIDVPGSPGYFTRK